MATVDLYPKQLPLLLLLPGSNQPIPAKTRLLASQRNNKYHILISDLEQWKAEKEVKKKRKKENACTSKDEGIITSQTTDRNICIKEEALCIQTHLY